MESLLQWPPVQSVGQSVWHLMLLFGKIHCFVYFLNFVFVFTLFSFCVSEQKARCPLQCCKSLDHLYRCLQTGEAEQISLAAPSLLGSGYPWEKDSLGCLCLLCFLLVFTWENDEKSSVIFHHNCILMNVWVILTYGIIFLVSHCYFYLLFVYLPLLDWYILIMPVQTHSVGWAVSCRFIDWE